MIKMVTLCDGCNKDILDGFYYRINISKESHENNRRNGGTTRELCSECAKVVNIVDIYHLENK
jgi:hypothetical protein